MLVKAFNPAMLMVVDAAGPVHACLGEVEQSAVLLLVLLDEDASCGLGKLVLTVCKATLIAISATIVLTPVLA